MESTSDRGYNGWENYETWATALWIDNEERSYRYWRIVAAECRGECAEEGCAVLADRLREAHTAAADEWACERSGLYCDLLGAALAEVDWLEIAEHLLAE